MSLAEIEQALLSSDINWKIVDTSGGLFAFERRRRSLGVPENSIADALQTASQRLSPPYSSRKIPPSAVDWRKRNGNWVGAVREQGECNSCTAFVVCDIMEAQHRINTKNPGDPISLSRADLFFCGHKGGCQVGMWPYDALMRAKTHGVASEADAPYDIVSEACLGAAPHLRILDFSYGQGDQRARKLVIEDKGPVLGIMRVFDDFFLYGGGVYRHKAGNDALLHAIVIVGYDDADSCWICKNSWGDGFGEKGFFRIAYGECELDARPFATVDVELLTT
jgi:C1A family cysteine protease